MAPVSTVSTFDTQIAGDPGTSGKAGKALAGAYSRKLRSAEAADQIDLARIGSSGSSGSVAVMSAQTGTDLRSRWSAEMAEQASQLAGQQGIAPQEPDGVAEAATETTSTLSTLNSTHASTDASTHRSIQLSTQVSPQSPTYRPSQLPQEETGREEAAWSSGFDTGGRVPAGTSTVIERQGGLDHSQSFAVPLRKLHRAGDIATAALKPSDLEKTREPESNRPRVAANLVSAKPDTAKGSTDKASLNRQIPRSGLASSTSTGASTDDRRVWNRVHGHGEAGAPGAPVVPQALPGDGVQSSPYAGEAGRDLYQSLAQRSSQGTGRLPAGSGSVRVSVQASSSGGFIADFRAGVFEPQIAADKIPAVLNVPSGTDLSVKTGRDLPQFASVLSSANSSTASAPGLSHRNRETSEVGRQLSPSDSARSGVEDGIAGAPSATRVALPEADRSSSLVATAGRQSSTNLTPHAGSSVISHRPAIGPWGDDGTLPGQAAETIEAGIGRPESGTQPGQVSGPVAGSISGLASQSAPVAENSSAKQSETSQPAHAAERTEDAGSSPGMVTAIATPVAGSARETLTKAVSGFPSSPERAITLKGSASAVPGAIPRAVSGTVSSTGAAARSAVVSDAQLVFVSGAPVFVSGQQGAAFAPASHSEAESIAVVSRSPFQVMDSIGTMDVVHGTETQSGVTTGRMIAGSVSTAPPTLEMGYQDPALGYVELHAHISEGGVHASLSAQSPESGVTLEGHLHSLADWMNERQTPLESLTVLPFSAGRTQWDGGNAGHRDGNNGSHAAGGQNAADGEGKAHSGYVPAVETTTILSGRVSDQTAGLLGISGESMGSPAATGAMQTMDLNDGAVRIGRTISVLA